MVLAKIRPIYRSGIVADVNIAEAIQLFQYSNTARGQGGAVGDWPKKVLQNLWQLYGSQEIGYTQQPKKTTWGSWLQDRPGYDLQINPDRINGLPENQRLGAVSLELVHEGAHAATKFSKPSQLLYDELAARKLQIYYFQELSGPGVFNEASDPPGPGKRTEIIRLPTSGAFDRFRRQSEELKKDQLIDHLLEIDSYNNADYISADWVLTSLHNWGGVRNRWPNTKGVYIRWLASKRDPFYGPAILEIMDSISRREDWNDMMDAAGSLRAIQLTLEELAYNRRYAPQVAALQRRWRINLDDEPPGGR
jgi:hypothetical protein